MNLTLCTLWTIVGLSGSCILFQARDEIPPRHVLKQIGTEQDKRWYGQWNEMIYEEVVNKTTDVEASTLLDLVYGREEIPGLPAVPNPATINGHHTTLQILNEWSKIQRGYDSLEEVPIYSPPAYVGDELIEEGETIYRPARSLVIELWVWNSKEEAYNFAKKRFHSAIYQERGRLPSGLSSGLGERYWVRREDIDCVGFVQGRLVAQITLYEDKSGRKPVGLGFVESSAWGVLYRILQHPPLSLSLSPLSVLIGDQTVSSKAVKLRGVLVAPLSVLQAAGVQVQSQRSDQEWTVRLSQDSQWVRVKAFSWEMETSKGKVKLERPVFPYQGELVVPLRQVAESLGLKVSEQGSVVKVSK